MRILTVLLLLLTQTCSAQFVHDHGHLHVRDLQLTDEHEQPVVLRGMSFGWHNFWPRFYNPQAVDWLAKDWKCTVVRAAIGVEPKGGYVENPGEAVKRAEAVIDGAIRSGIYVLIDWHSHNIRLNEAKSFFTAMAKKYGRYPNVIYELFNEPDQETWPQVKAYAEELIHTIRAIDPQNLILVGCPHWDQDIHLVAADPIRDANNIMYTVHFYAATHKQELRDRCDAALKRHIPIFISESAGMESSGDGPLNEAEWQRWIDWAEARRISWITWSVSDKDETCSVLKKSARSDGGWQESDLKESGVKARAVLRRYNGDK
jgi:endoglucanase